MTFLTSISPRHVVEGRQQECVRSWLKYGEVISFNHPSEIEALKTQGYDEHVTFLPTYRTQKPMFGKHYVTINAIADYIKEHSLQYACMINSDIEIDTDEDTMNDIKMKMSTQFVYLHRYDFDSDKSKGNIYMDGVDAFFMNAEMAETFPQVMYCLGQTYFDLWIPWHFLVMREMQITTVNSKPIIFHKRHPAQYNQGDWHRMGKFTGLLIGMPFQKPEEVSGKMYTTLRKNTIYT